MALGCAWSVALAGLDGHVVQIEADIAGGLPRTVLVGLPDTALHEAKDRCKAAVTNSKLGWPSTLLTINLSPATLPKSGSHYDLAIVAAVLAAAAVLPGEELVRTVLLGELGLDGRVRPIRGILPATLAAVQQGFSQVVVPISQAGEARLVDGVTVFGVASVTQLVALLRGTEVPFVEPVAVTPSPELPGRTHSLDLADVVGQYEPKWSLEVAAAGGHHLLMHGPPGVGKTMLAERLPGLLPELSLADALEVSAIHSLAGFQLDDALITRAPYADPHHSATVASLVGGGARVARPGAISRAHRGVLFLDEAPEFPFGALDALRTPLESGVVTISRSQVQARFPARFQLVLAANPCPCGNATVAGAHCECAPSAVLRYAAKLSKPIRDRIDIHQAFRLLPRHAVRAALGQGESSAAVALRVREARERQAARLVATGWRTNGEVGGAYLRKVLPTPAGFDRVQVARDRGSLSERGVDIVARVAWTLADLAGRDRPAAQDTAAALALRRSEPALLHEGADA